MGFQEQCRLQAKAERVQRREDEEVALAGSEFKSYGKPQTDRQTDTMAT